MTRTVDILGAYLGKGWTLSTAESCTGGLLSAAITDVAGSSKIFRRGYVTYSNEAKTDMLGVRAETLDAHGAVSEEVALEMAQGAQSRAGADVAVAITGIAGPGSSQHKPEGRVCFALATPDKPPVSETVDFGPLGRGAVRQAARDHAISLLLAATM